MDAVRTLTLTFQFCNNYAQISDEELRRAIENELSDWGEGRYRPPREMLGEALRQIINDAVSRAVWNRLESKYQSRSVKSDDGKIQTRSTAILFGKMAKSSTDVTHVKASSVTTLSTAEDQLVVYVDDEINSIAPEI